VEAERKDERKRGREEEKKGRERPLICSSSLVTGPSAGVISETGDCEGRL
jgi:hypothetical protein